MTFRFEFCKRTRLTLVSAFALSVALAASAFATDYYVDSKSGDDAATGLSPDKAWKTLERVSNAEELAPGDVVKFKRGCVWRGGLKPRSGEPNSPITYTSYGEGAKPSFWRSVALNNESDWLRVGENLWATRPTTVRKIGDAGDFLGKSDWVFYQEEGAKVKYSSKELEKGARSYLFECESCGTASNHIQWIKAPFAIEKDKYYRLSMDVKATQDVTISASLMSAAPPWTGYGEVVCGQIKAGPKESRQYTIFHSEVDADDARVTLYLGGRPEGVTVQISNIDADEVSVDSLDFSPDVGNIILDGNRAAFKRWTLDDLKAQDDFCYERGEGRVWFYSKENPAKKYRSLEAAVMRHVVNHSNVHDAVFDGLDIRYGSAHGFGGSGSKRMIIRNCDICWIGGGDQYEQGGDGRRVRFGNGIEFWSDAEDNLVENCRIWEVYDAAITNQGSGVNAEKNIVYRNNLIWNCEYSFEYWNRDSESITENVSFVDNVCLNAGYGWGHVQRPDRNGHCLMFYSNTAQTKNFVVKNNVFANATEGLIRSDVEWTPEQPQLDENVYWQDNKELPYVVWRNENLAKDAFADWQKQTGQEKNAKLEKVDAAKLIPTDVK